MCLNYIIDPILQIKKNLATYLISEDEAKAELGFSYISGLNYTNNYYRLHLPYP